MFTLHSAMPTPSRTYSPSAAERLRLALLALAASAATLTSNAQDAEGDFDDPDVLGEIPEDIEEGGAYAFFPCSNPGCKAEDCEGECQDGEPCAGCDTRSGDEEKTHAENAESAETKPHAESAEGAESDSHAGNAESAESQSHAEGAETKTHAESAESAEPEFVPTVPTVPASATNAAVRGAGSVPEASASGPAPADPDRILIRGMRRALP